MDTGEDRNFALEAEYVRVFGNALSRCVEELVVLCHLLVDDSKENGEAVHQFRVAIDQVAIEEKGVGLLSSMNDGENRVKLISLLSAGIKK
eukprot:scaffold1157_cov122-Cylindrotheca_fusiformis.AAC.16